MSYKIVSLHTVNPSQKSAAMTLDSRVYAVYGSKDDYLESLGR